MSSICFWISQATIAEFIIKATLSNCEAAFINNDSHAEGFNVILTFKNTNDLKSAFSSESDSLAQSDLLSSITCSLLSFRHFPSILL